jgi:hypothetical protein
VDKSGRVLRCYGRRPAVRMSLGSSGECDAIPAFLQEFGRHRYVFVWDYLIINRLNNVFIWGQPIMGTPFSKSFEPLQVG